ncbi:3-oxoacyl-[acyl-carrier protein] reductase [Allocatelliglobosispora scoriae]|uniref:3-oxoacyl-[acyl-carrier protein] reductase n=1 Tax=Allocatelliglobosispora scoriae TaxID=643052 RepID=A0A841BHT3_9ACTN|nr:SDR family NAD(P)-dependent oxidoreductase [Allocatelliglobosispora scoriae]MBB5866736.1 3-oxoacyl-[acyl-carrier protein] reductase [Allocatelliglobosispora scoriae]
MDPRFKGKVTIITGGTRGIGNATARAFAAAGAIVVITGRDETVVKAEADRICTETGGTVEGRVLSAADFPAAATLVKSVAAQHGGVHILVANAAAMTSAPLGLITEQSARHLTDTNLLGTLAVVQAAARAMLPRRSGAIVVVGSLVADRGAAGQSVYAATKAAVTALVRSAAIELGPAGIRVNAVAPGIVDTDLTAALRPEVIEARRGQTPLRRIGLPAEVAQAICFLSSDEAAFITGQVLGVDGGLTL